MTLTADEEIVNGLAMEFNGWLEHMIEACETIFPGDRNVYALRVAFGAVRAARPTRMLRTFSKHLQEHEALILGQASDAFYTDIVPNIPYVQKMPISERWNEMSDSNKEAFRTYTRSLVSICQRYRAHIEQGEPTGEPQQELAVANAGAPQQQQLDFDALKGFLPDGVQPMDIITNGMTLYQEVSDDIRKNPDADVDALSDEELTRRMVDRMRARIEQETRVNPSGAIARTYTHLMARLDAQPGAGMQSSAILDKINQAIAGLESQGLTRTDPVYRLLEKLRAPLSEQITSVDVLTRDNAEEVFVRGVVSILDVPELQNFEGLMFSMMSSPFAMQMLARMNAAGDENAADSAAAAAAAANIVNFGPSAAKRNGGGGGFFGL